MPWSPKKLDDIVGQEKVVSVLKQLEKPVNMLFVGPPGVGKTTAAYAYCIERGIPVIELNASDERGIDVIRTKVKELAFASGFRCILLDEADSLTADAQHALRRIMERAVGAFFILTANEEYRIIDAIKSRCLILRFRKLDEVSVLKALLKHKKPTNEKEKRLLIAIAKKANGDLRTALKWLETVRDPSILEAMEQVPLPLEVLQDAWSGDLRGAILKLERLYVENKLDVKKTVTNLFAAISNLDTSDYRKAKLYEKLAEVERGLRLGTSPLIQLASFLASVYAVRQVRGE